MKIIVNTLIKNDKNQILMVQEAKENVYKLWNFPAGHLDVGENIFDGAIREAKEETGYDIKLTGFIQIQNCIMKNENVVLFMFAGEIVGGKKNFDRNEILDVQFIDADKLLKMKDNELRSSNARHDSIKRFLDNKIYPLELISNLDFRK